MRTADANHLINKMLRHLLLELPVGDRLCYFQKQLLGGLGLLSEVIIYPLAQIRKSELESDGFIIRFCLRLNSNHSRKVNA